MTKSTYGLPEPVRHLSFGRLRDRVWKRRGLAFETKLHVYRAVVLPFLLYGSESWTVYSRHLQKLQSFHMRCLRQILQVKWQDHVPDTEVLQRSKSMSIGSMLMESQLRWSGHIARMPDYRLPKRVFFGELCSGNRSRGRPRKRYKDKLKVALKRKGLKIRQLLVRPFLTPTAAAHFVPE